MNRVLIPLAQAKAKEALGEAIAFLGLALFAIAVALLAHGLGPDIQTFVEELRK